MDNNIITIIYLGGVVASIVVYFYFMLKLNTPQISFKSSGHKKSKKPTDSVKEQIKELEQELFNTNDGAKRRELFDKIKELEG